MVTLYDRTASSLLTVTLRFLSSPVKMYQVMKLFAVLLWLGLASSSPVAKRNATTCVVDGHTYSEGESVTGDPCDRCMCTRYGLMCELLGCPHLTCAQRVMGECCEECAELNCVHNFEAGEARIPETGCRHNDNSGDNVCFCYHDNGQGGAEVYCLPAFPMDDTPSCIMLP